MICVAEIVAVRHVAVVAESHNAEAEILIIFEEVGNHVGHLTANIFDVSCHGAGGVEGNYHVEFSHPFGCHFLIESLRLFRFDLNSGVSFCGYFGFHNDQFCFVRLNIMV